MSTIGTLKYRRYQAKSPQDPDAPAKWYARAVQDRTVEFEDFVTHISEHNSPYSRGVIHGVLIDMLAFLRGHLLEGRRDGRRLGHESHHGRPPERAQHQDLEQRRASQEHPRHRADRLYRRRHPDGRRHGWRRW